MGFKAEGCGNFPGGPVVKNPPSSAGDVSSFPGRRTKILHDTRQLSPGMAAREKPCMLQ